jgi:hypothetical protein
MKTTKFTRIITIILGAFLVVYAANQFLHVIPTGYGDMQEFTRLFLDAVLPFLPFLYIFEILLGIILIWNKWVPFLIILLAPLSVNFLIFNFVNGGWNIVPALIVALLNIILLYQYKEKYKPLFE